MLVQELIEQHRVEHFVVHSLRGLSALHATKTGLISTICSAIMLKASDRVESIFLLLLHLRDHRRMLGKPDKKMFLNAIDFHRFNSAEHLLRSAIRAGDRCFQIFVTSLGFRARKSKIMALCMVACGIDTNAWNSSARPNFSARARKPASGGGRAPVSVSEFG